MIVRPGDVVEVRPGSAFPAYFKNLAVVAETTHRARLASTAI